ncbi:MAG: lytic transglycosylase domain-containing protein [Betaproteobacteria bacterium]|nr:lytic transglycosylase domain-containing protein [Betaproteobacteria bacterium]
MLEPWVGYWHLRLKLEERTTEEVRWFLSRNDGSLLAEQLRRDWLKVLGRRGEWGLFTEEAPRVFGDDPEVTCYSLLARAQMGDASAAAELRPLWLAPRDLPEGCVPLVDGLLTAGQWGPQQVWERFRMLVEANQLAAARRLVARLPRDETPDLKLLDRAINAPVQHVEGNSLARRTQRELYIAAVLRIARDDPPLAASYWRPPVRERFTPPDQAWVLGAIATAAARRHIADAVGWFAEADRLSAGIDGLLNDEQWAWRARIALRQDNWGEVQAAIARMSLAGRTDPTWVYWLGRALKVQGRTAEQRTTAEAQFARIADDFSFYGRLAAEELGRVVHVPATAASPTSEEMAALSGNAGLRRALALYGLDLRTEATREWNWAIRGMDDRSLLAAAQLARNNEIWDRAINTADRTVALHDFNVRYLAPYREVLSGAAKSRALEEPLVLGLVRQESRFLSRARSSVGATGLMQLMPATAQWVAGKMGMKDYSWSRAHEPQVNAALGTFYLRRVLDDFDGHPVLAAAAYNAGPGRARRWRDARPLEGAIYAESIPFNETRDYVKKVMSNTIFYSAVLGGEARTLKSRLGTVAGRSAADGLVALRADPTP